MKRRIHLLTCLLAGVLLVLAGCNSSGSSSDTLDEGEQVRVTLLQTSDVHHRASGTGASATYSPLDGVDSSATCDLTKGGYGRLATRIIDIRSEKAEQDIPTLLVDSGDFMMGTVYDLTVAFTPAAFLFMQDIKYDAVTLGNHEFDYGAGPIAQFINTARGVGGNDFTVPIVATNMVTSAEESDDDGLEALKAAGVIKNTLVKTLSNGLKVGIIGLLGERAEKDAPLLDGIVSFHNDMDNADDVAFLQGKVDYLKNEEKVHLVIALSHSGVSSTDTNDPRGDDIDLAKKVSGIDIIASGHEHKMTETVIEVGNEADATHTTYIICPGRYGENLSQLDITYTQGSGIDVAVLTNHAIDDSIPGNFMISSTVQILDSGLDKELVGKGLPKVNQVIGQSASDNLAKPVKAGESGMGNLVADSLRYLLKSKVDAASDAGVFMPATVGVVANGVIRNGFAWAQYISFADMYSVLPLGMTLDKTQQSIPGYPLVAVYLTKPEIKNVCRLAAYVEAAGDAVFMQALKDAESPLYGGLSMLKPEFYLNLSGVRYTHGGQAGGYQVGSVALYANNDYQCQGVATDIDDGALNPSPLYPVVVDLYVYLMMQSEDMKLLLSVEHGLGIPVTPRDKNGTPIPEEADYKTILSMRIDSDPEKDGIQETKEWMALLKYLTSSVADHGLSPRIDDSFYAADTIGDGLASRVNTPPPAD